MRWLALTASRSATRSDRPSHPTSSAGNPAPAVWAAYFATRVRRSLASRLTRDVLRRRDDLHGVGESVRAEVGTIHGQYLVNGRVAVHDGEDYGVDIRECVTSILREDLPCAGVRGGRRGHSAKSVGVLVDQGEGSQGDPRIPPRTDTLVVPQFRERLADHQMRYQDGVADLTSGDDAPDSPLVMTVGAVERRDDESAVGECGQRP